MAFNSEYKLGRETLMRALILDGVQNDYYGSFFALDAMCSGLKVTVDTGLSRSIDIYKFLYFASSKVKLAKMSVI